MGERGERAIWGKMYGNTQVVQFGEKCMATHELWLSVIVSGTQPLIMALALQLPVPFAVSAM